MIKRKGKRTCDCWAILKGFALCLVILAHRFFFLSKSANDAVSTVRNIKSRKKKYTVAAGIRAQVSTATTWNSHH